jgi:hypothetical protein
MKESDKEPYVLVSVLWYSGGGGEASVLHRGTKDECQRAGRSVPALTYSGNKTIIDAGLSVVTEAQYLADFEAAKNDGP